MLTLPGLIDIHVHLRDPGQTEKEDFFTGTSAAIAGGFTTIVDMPNNKTPITTLERLEDKIKRAQEQTVCDIGFYFGSLGDNFEEFEKVKDKVLGLKLYMNVTTGHFLINDETMEKIYRSWNKNTPILVHAEEEMTDVVVRAVRATGKQTHFCHVSSEYELSTIMKAKEEGMPVTCGVCPHHLFLTENDVKTLKSFGIMKPPLKTEKDKEFLWKNLQYVDVIESDHAPHTLEEKKSENPPFGVPGLETTLPLLLTAAANGKLTIDRIVELCHTNPKKILNLKTYDSSKIEVDIDATYELQASKFFSKCKWSPFDGWKMKGKVTAVYLHGNKVFENGELLAKPGSGSVLETND